MAEDKEEHIRAHAVVENQDKEGTQMVSGRMKPDSAMKARCMAEGSDTMDET